MFKKVFYAAKSKRQLTQRDFIRAASLMAACAILVACAPQIEQVEVTRVVEVEGEQVEVTREVEVTAAVEQKGWPPVQDSYTKEWIAEQLTKEGQVLFWFPAGANFHVWMNDFFMPKFGQHIQDTYGVNLEMARLSSAGGDAAFWQKLQAYNEAGGAPGEFDIDVAKINPDIRTQDGISNGLFMPILPQYAALAPNLADVVEYGLNAYTLDDSTYAIPFYQPNIVMWYNSDQVTDPPQTIEELGEWVKENPGRFLYEDPRADTAGNQFLLTVMHALGDENDPSTWDAGFEFLREIEPFVYPAHPADGGPVLELFRRGEIGLMNFWNDWAYFYKLDLDIPFMQNYILETGGPIRSTPWAIPANAQHPLAAILFVDFALSPEIQSQIGSVMRQIPANMAPETWESIPSDAFGFEYQYIVDRTFASFDSRANVENIQAMTDRWVTEVLER